MAKIITSIIFISLSFLFAQEKSDDFQIGIYGLQSPVGTKGYGNGKLDEVIEDIELIKSSINATIVMRSWNRKKYPNWDFFGYFTNHMKDMYSLTKDDSGNSGIQVLTPSLYWIFSEPAIKSINENEKGFDRHLNRELFKKFVFKVLAEEYEMVSREVKCEKKIVEILTSKTKRPLGGWYLDDEPLIRNHDLSIAIELGWYIRQLEKDFFEQDSILNKYPDKLEAYYKPRYIAFDADDLHKYKKSGRPEDAITYNLNGKQIKFSINQIYTVFPEDVVDVLLVDFYKPDPEFWNKIISDVKREYNLIGRNMPKVMPIIYANYKKKYKSSYKNYYLNTFNQLKNLDIDGIWIYLWHGSKENVGAKDIWNSDKVKLNNFIKDVE